jgi:hypothetical protein
MPDMAKKIHEAIRPVVYENNAIAWPSKPMAEELDCLQADMPINPPDVLIDKITDEQIEELKVLFGGAAAE